MHHPITERSSRMSAQPRRRASRFALMGAAGALAFGAAIGAPVGKAFAEAPATLSAPVGPSSFADVVERVKGAVVAIKVKAYEESHSPFEGQELSPDDPMYRFFKRFGGEVPQKHMTQSQGSGFIISADGYVVTNNHVVEHASDVEVALDDGRSLPAKVIGTDKRTDLALLKVSDGAKLPYVEWSGTQPRVGDWVIAVGNPFGLGGSVTAGIVSARGRDIGAGPYDDFLQIDAPVNRGNSGGPAFDERGAVVGVNTAIYSPSGGSVGIGFAIPAEVAKDVITALKEKGVVSRGWIGVKIQPVTPEIADSLGLKSTKGALIAQPQKGAPAEAAGLKAGDVIVAVNGDKIESPRDLARRIAAMGPNKTVDLTYLRNGAEKSAKLTLGKLPEEREARADDEDTGGPSGGSQVASLGIEVAPASEVRGGRGEGLYVTDIDPSGAAAQKGLRRGDVIVEAGGQPVNSRSDLSNAIDGARKEGRRSILLRVKSADGSKFIAVPVKQSAG
ncbi:Do family serine endopeptidase [Methylocystis sp. IM3]|jgi:serine protease Do|uniref:Do family serine endopeptidase n=1 Tax=unclassified Methylocystis TaxID=2625913 RepID=UPI000FA0E005|nr:MAG: Do family serine endopeptidase [Hyphomicrobiales bacterium]